MLETVIIRFRISSVISSMWLVRGMSLYSEFRVCRSGR